MMGIHPEDFCECCGRPNIVWYAPNELWNRVAAEKFHILCPVCFVRLCESVGVTKEDSAWSVTPGRGVVP
jgi:hypothetical protein